jgi:hypothetical protein
LATLDEVLAKLSAAREEEFDLYDHVDAVLVAAAVIYALRPRSGERVAVKSALLLLRDIQIESNNAETG